MHACMARTCKAMRAGAVPRISATQPFINPAAHLQSHARRRGAPCWAPPAAGAAAAAWWRAPTNRRPLPLCAPGPSAQRRAPAAPSTPLPPMSACAGERSKRVLQLLVCTNGFSTEAGLRVACNSAQKESSKCTRANFCGARLGERRQRLGPSAFFLGCCPGAGRT